MINFKEQPVGNHVLFHSWFGEDKVQIQPPVGNNVVLDHGSKYTFYFHYNMKKKEKIHICINHSFWRKSEPF